MSHESIDGRSVITGHLCEQKKKSFDYDRRQMTNSCGLVTMGGRDSSYFQLFDDSHLFCYQVKRDNHKESHCDRVLANSLDLSTDGIINILLKLFIFPPEK